MATTRFRVRSQHQKTNNDGPGSGRGRIETGVLQRHDLVRIPDDAFELELQLADKLWIIYRKI
jgi:hypothetical protein